MEATGTQQQQKEQNNKTELTAYQQPGIVLSSYDFRCIREAGQFIREHIAEYRSIAMLSRKFHINIQKIKTGFVLLYGTTIFNYVQQVKMKKAIMLLQLPQPSIAEIAYSLGYSDPPNFTAAFKRYFGIPPTAARKKLWSQPVSQTFNFQEGLFLEPTSEESTILNVIGTQVA